MSMARYAVSRQEHKPSPAHIITPEEVQELVPILNMDGVSGSWGEVVVIVVIVVVVVVVKC